MESQLIKLRKYHVSYKTWNAFDNRDLNTVSSKSEFYETLIDAKWAFDYHSIRHELCCVENLETGEIIFDNR